MKRTHRKDFVLRKTIRALSLVLLTIGSFFLVISQIRYTTMPSETFNRLSPLDLSAPFGVEWTIPKLPGQYCYFEEMVTDKNGSLYAVGTRDTTRQYTQKNYAKPFYIKEFVLMKLDVDGQIEFLSTQEISYENIAIDLWVSDSGDIFCILEASYVYLVKFNSTGDIQWKMICTSPSGTDIRITGDSNRNLVHIINGKRYSTFNFDGVLLREQYFGFDEWAVGLWCDIDGNVFISGRIFFYAGIEGDFFICGFDPDGQVFLNYTALPMYEDLVANKIWGDRYGNLYALVESEYDDDWQFLLKITRNGDLLWKKWIPGFFEYYSEDISIVDLWCDEEGRVFLLGEFPTGDGDNTLSKSIIEITPSGDLFRIFPLTAESIQDLTGDNRGNLFVNTYSYGYAVKSSSVTKIGRDADWDGESDLAEFKAGTNPLSAMDNSAIRQGYLNWGIVLIITGVLAPIGEFGFTRIKQVLKKTMTSNTTYSTKIPGAL